MDESSRKLLKEITILRLLPDETQEQLIGKFAFLKFKFGDIIVKEGDPADSFYLMTSGKARVVTVIEDGSEIPLKTLNPGDCFGEMGLLSTGVRTKTVRASDDVSVLRLAGKDFNNIISRNSEIRNYIKVLIKYRNLENFLRQYTTLAKVPSDLLTSLLKKLTALEVKAGEVIIKEGDHSGPMFIIEQGRCRIYRKGKDANQTLAYLRQGEFFGELSLIQKSPRTATVEAVSDCTLLALDPEAFREIFGNYQALQAIVNDRVLKYQTRTDSDRMPLDFARILESSDDTDNDENNELFKSSTFPTVLSESSTQSVEEDPKPKKTIRPKRSRKFQFIHQIDQADCGSAALGMVCKHFGYKLNLAYIREISNTSIEGTTLKDLCKAANSLGLNARAAKLSIRNLDTISFPSIIHWRNNHWVVLTQGNKDRFQIADPAEGLVWVNQTDLEKNWSGYAVLFGEPTHNVAVPKVKNFIHWILPQLLNFKWSLSKTLLISLIISLLQLLFPVLTQIIVDDVIVADNPNELNLYVMAFGAVLAFTLILTIFQRRTISYLTAHFDEIITDTVLERLLSFPMTYFTNRSSDDVQRRLEGAREIRHFLSHSVLGGLIAIIQLVAFLLLMAIFSVKMTLIFFIIAPIYLGLMFFSAKILKPAFDELQSNEAKFRMMQNDISKGIQAIKAAGAEKSFGKKIKKKFSQLAQDQSKSNFNIFCYDGTIQTMGFLSTILFLWLGARLVLHDQLSMGSFIGFQMLIAMSYSPIITILNMWEDLQFSSVILNRLNDLTVCAPEMASSFPSNSVTTLQGTLEFRNVTYEYPSGNSGPSVQDLNFSALPGDLIGIAGRNGSGKTSMVKLIAALVEPTAGEILYDGIPSNTLNLSELRQFVGLVSQNEYIFSTSIIENIALGDPDPNLSRIIQAAQLANAHDFIMQFPNEYKTTIPEIEAQLTHMQKQSIAFARALYRDPPILILDEATSTMDLESERAIFANIEKIRHGRVIFIATHKLESIDHADQILVLADGRMVEKGSHSALMVKKGLYSQLYNA